ncbi:uncharacterized protein LOC114915392 [Cajanus cajan]|uniref:uncharacterized protein LOC114915392 n=1 Tax=Cajanus cajan TaxID=3821 RepID=UPI0010FB06B8|nr:uncharacterized protein LOC114915392 [Cajanus cajan]
MGVPPYGILSLSGSRDGGLFTPYSQSYKNFKQEFFRVALVGVDPLEDEVFYFGGLPRFPFYWCPKPSRFHGLGDLKVTAAETAAIKNLAALPRPLDCKLVLSLANSPFRERGLESIMGRNLWRQLKHRYNVSELEVPEPPEEDAVSLKTHRKRKRGKEEVGGTSASRDAEEATSRVVDAVDLTDSPPAKEASPVATAEVVPGVGLTAPDAEGGVGVAEVEVCVSGQTVRVAKVAGNASGPELQEGKAADPEVQASGLAAQAAGAESGVPKVDSLGAEQGGPSSAAGSS